MLVVCLLLPVFIIVYYSRNINKWSDREFRKRYGSVLEDLNLEKTHEKKWLLFFSIQLILRRVAFAITIIWFQDFFVLHLVMLVGFAFTNAAYMINSKPFEDINFTRMEVFDEITQCLLLYHLICFTDFLANPRLSYDIGYSYAGFAILNIIVHDARVGYSSAKSVIKRIRKV